MAGHEQFKDSASPYLLGALPELEVKAFERHVMACDACRDQVERLRFAVEALPRSVTPMNAPASLRRGIMDVVAADVAAREGPKPGESLVRRVRRGLEAVTHRFRPAVAWGSAALLLFTGVAAGVALDEIGGPDDQRIAALVNEEKFAEGSGTLIVPEGRDRAILSVHGLPTLPAEDSNEVYQLWLVRGSEVIPSSLLSVGEDGSGSAAIPSGVEDVDAVWVSREPAGGARVPSDPVVMRVNLD